MKYLTLLQSCAAFAGSAHAQCGMPTDTNCGGIPDDVFIDFRLVDEDIVQIDVVTRNNTWVGLVLGANNMSDAPFSDMIQFSANGE